MGNAQILFKQKIALSRFDRYRAVKYSQNKKEEFKNSARKQSAKKE